MNLKKKLVLFLAILFSLNLFAQAPGESLTISFQNIPLSEAIKKIESVSKYTFFYDALKLDVNQKVSLNANNTPVRQAISQMLAKSILKQKQHIRGLPLTNNLHEYLWNLPIFPRTGAYLIPNLQFQGRQTVCH